MVNKSKHSIDYSPAEERRVKKKKSSELDQNMNASSLFWGMIGVLFLLVAVLITVIGSQFVEIETLTNIKDAVLSRQVNESGGSTEFWSVTIFTLSGVSVIVSSITTIMSIIFGIRGAVFEEHKKTWGIIGALTSATLFFVINIPVLQFSFSYILTVFV